MINILEKINKNILLLGLALLLFRNTSFALTHIPKPFEICFIVVTLGTIADLIIRKKIKEFFTVIPKKIWVSIIVLCSSIFFGWGIAVWYRGLPSTINMVFEFGSFIVAVSTAILILYYSHNDPSYVKKCLYALVVPAVYTIFILVPQLSSFFNVAQGATFNGFTENVNIVSKALLIPLMFFTTYSFFEHKNIWYRVGYIVLAAMLLALLFWTAQRAAIGAFLIGIGIVLSILMISIPYWKKRVTTVLIFILILGSGFLLVPTEGKKVAINRLLHFDGNQSGYAVLKDKTVSEVLELSVAQNNTVAIKALIDIKKSPEPRFQIWSYYSRVIIQNPLGLGPNTHMNARIPFAKGEFINPGPHNTYLQVLLWGGWVGLASFGYILIQAFKQIDQRLRQKVEPLPLVLLGSLVALGIALFFNDGLQSYWVWGVIALALRI